MLHMMGVNGAVAGQVVDIESEGRDDINLATLEFIHTHKTGAMIVASVVSGAVLAGADESAITLLSSYGEKIGLAFQIIDDILDVTSTSEHLGKTARKDIKMRKATFPQLLGLDASRKRAAELIDAARADLAPLGDDATPLLALAEYVYSRSR
ncbi:MULTISPECIES: polyprenyl synthetase family protein [Frankia]|uniref:polyprenyl synthetase family protein n=1 Tax=Frankia TaxID=1854 RepID=UPI002E807A2B|nr:polyprenyl synthetase family protein [Frankia sp. CcI6]